VTTRDEGPSELAPETTRRFGLNEPCLHRVREGLRLGILVPI